MKGTWALGIVVIVSVMTNVGWAENEGTAGQTLAASRVVANVADAAERYRDSDGDGYPDVVELGSSLERAAFLDWFASIAEAQYTAPAPEWKDRDCSGLIRFAYVEALKPKTPHWFAQFPFLPTPRTPPVASLSYPLPLLSRSLFRVAPGTYRPDDVTHGRFVGMATAQEMLHYMSVPLGRDVREAERGDLLFFAHPIAEGSGYHSMVYLGDGMVVYHTGLSPDEGGEVRLLSLDTLRRHPDPSWRPVADNPHFLGFHRWKIVD